MKAITADSRLIQRVQMEATTGANVHEVNNLLHRYVLTVALAQMEQDKPSSQEHIALAQGLEAQLRQRLWTAIRRNLGEGPEDSRLLTGQPGRSN